MAWSSTEEKIDGFILSHGYLAIRDCPFTKLGMLPYRTYKFLRHEISLFNNNTQLA